MNTEKNAIEVPKNRTIFIGDIQGCFDEFMLLIEKLKLLKNDIVYLTGDIINKGPKSFETLDFIYNNRDKFITVTGNHELNFLKFLDGKSYGKDDKNFKILEKQISKRPELLKYLKNLPLYIKNEDFILVHGGKVPGKKFKDHSSNEITRIRDFNGQPWYELYSKKKKIIYGHWALDGLRITKNTIGIDTGCVYGKMLTAYILETGEIIQQQALNLYINVFKNENT